MLFPRSGPSQTPARPPARLRECRALSQPALASLREAVCARRPRFRGDPEDEATLGHSPSPLRMWLEFKNLFHWSQSPLPVKVFVGKQRPGD